MSIYNENEPIPPEEFPPDAFSTSEFPPETYFPEDFPTETPPIVETVLPPVEKPVQVEERPLKAADRSTMSQSTMLFGLVALSLSMIGAAFLIFDAFQHGLTDNLMSALVKVVPVILAYLVGWTLCLVSIRSFSNLVLPLLIKYYLWVTLAGLIILYFKIMQKLFQQTYDLPQFFAYNMILAAVLAGLIGLHLLLDQQDLRRYSIPIIMASTWHLLLMVVRFVVLELGNPVYLVGDLYFFVVMFGLAALMLAHLGILNPLRYMVDVFFQPSGNKEVVV